MSHVYALFEHQVRTNGDAAAIVAGEAVLTYEQLWQRAERAASLLVSLGVGRGERIGILSENRTEFLELELAAAKLGIIVACQNWRLTRRELDHCLALVTPSILFVSPRHRELLTDTARAAQGLIEFGSDYEQRLRQAAHMSTSANDIDPESGLIILYTSGTTGFPKAATISQRALVARKEVWRVDHGIDRSDAFLAWSPLFHMAANDQSLAALMSGSTVVIEDGFDSERVVRILSQHKLGWFLLVPGVIDPLLACLSRQTIEPRGVKVVGSMADLVPPASVAKVTRLVGAPYLNSFGATETGMPPLSGSVIPVGMTPASLSKRPSSACEIKLVAEDWREVGPTEAGEIAVRGPTVFSGYWTPQGCNMSDFSADGFFRMGDVFRRNADGSYDFVDRAKYMIKSGGENIYPAEIERVLLSAEHVLEACVVKAADDRWGEAPVAFVATDGAGIPAERLRALCKEQLAKYKCPREIRFVAFEAFPRSTTGKILRHEVEKWVMTP